MQDIIHHAYFCLQYVYFHISGYKNDESELTSISVKGVPTAAPAGETCLKLVAAGNPTAAFSSLTSCQAFNASHKFIKPGEPFTTFKGNLGRFVKIWAGF